MATYNKLTVEDLIVKRLWVEHKRIDSINLGALVVSDESYKVGIGTDDPELRLDIIGVDGVRLPNGNISERPSLSDLNGIIRYNSEEKNYESYFSDKWRPFHGSQLEVSLDSNTDKSGIIINKQGSTSSTSGNSIEFRLESSTTPSLSSNQAKISVRNVGAQHTGEIVFETANGSNSYNDRMIIKKDGLVGIGTNNPVSLLTISTDITQNVDLIETLINLKSKASTTNFGTALSFDVSTDGSNFSRVGKIAGVLTDDYSGDLRFYTKKSDSLYDEDGLSEKMRIDKDGNIALGLTTNINSKLNILNDGTKDSTIILSRLVTSYNGSGSNGNIIEFKTNFNQFEHKQCRIRGIDDNVNSDYGGIAFDYTNPFSASYQEGIRLSSFGLVGIGTNDPKVILDINSTTAIQLPVGTTSDRTSISTIRQGMIRYNSDLSQFEGFGAGNAWGSLGGVIDVDKDTYISAETSPNDDNDELLFYTANNPRMKIKHNGVVCIPGDFSSDYLLTLRTGNDDGFVLQNYSGDAKGKFMLNTSGDALLDLKSNEGNTHVLFSADSNSNSYLITKNFGIGYNQPVGKLQITTTESLDATDSAHFDNYHVVLSKSNSSADNTEIGICFDIQGSGNYPSTGRGPGAAITHERTSTWSKGRLHFKTRRGLDEDDDCVTAMTINDNGCVGIGNTNPAHLLDLSRNNMNFCINPNTGFNPDAVYVGTVSNHDIVFGTNNTVRMMLNTSGRLGLGTTSLGANRLQINSASNENTLELRSYSNYGMILKNASATTKGRFILSGGGAGFIDLYGSSSTATVNIHSNGNSFFNGGSVGIGTSSINSNSKFHVEGKSRFVSDTAAISVVGEGRIVNKDDEDNQISLEMVDSTYGRIQTEPAASNLLLHLQSLGGSVGIGKDISDFANLTVKSQNRAISIRDSGNNHWAEIRAHNTGDVDSKAYLQMVGYAFKFNTNVDGTLTSDGSLFINHHGNVGIGAESGGKALEVTGEIQATSNITAYYSDERLKDFKGKIQHPLEKINQLNGYYFVANKLAKSLGYNNDRLQVGVSAQEVEKVLPEIVTEALIDKKYKTVWYEKLTPLLIEGMKEQQKQINELKEQINQLKNLIK